MAGSMAGGGADPLSKGEREGFTPRGLAAAVFWLSQPYLHLPLLYSG